MRLQELSQHRINAVWFVMSAGFDIAVIGAGPVGLCFARALAESGLQIVVLERLAEPALAIPVFDGREIALRVRRPFGIKAILGLGFLCGALELLPAFRSTEGCERRAGSGQHAAVSSEGRASCSARVPRDYAAPTPSSPLPIPTIPGTLSRYGLVSKGEKTATAAA